MTISRKHKRHGNQAFRERRWKETIDSYILTLDLDAYNDPQAAVVFSNRAAAYMALRLYDHALLDSHIAHSLDPTSSRYIARAAETHALASEFTEARENYYHAIELAESPEIESRMMSRLAHTEMLAHSSLLHAHPGTTDSSYFHSPPGDAYASRCQDALDGGMTMTELFASYPAAASAKDAHALIDRAMRGIKDEMIVAEDGKSQRPALPTHVIDIADGILRNPRGFHFLDESGCTKEDMVDKLHRQLDSDPVLVGNEPLLDLPVLLTQNKLNTIDDILDFFDERVKKDGGWYKGWLGAQSGFASLISVFIVRGFLADLDGDHATARHRYLVCMELIRCGRERWADVPDTDRGLTLHFTYQRKVGTLFLCSLFHSRSYGFDKRRGLSPHERSITKFANALLDDCQDPKHQVVADSPLRDRNLFEYNHDNLPKMLALWASAYALGCGAQERARVTKYGPVYYYNTEDAVEAAKEYALAAGWASKDDPDKAVLMYEALAYELRVGGWMVGQLFSRAAECELAFTTPQIMFGPARRLFPARQFVRYACTEARRHLQDLYDSYPSSFHYEAALTLPLQPIPDVLISEKDPGVVSVEQYLDEERKKDFAGSIRVYHEVEMVEFQKEELDVIGVEEGLVQRTAMMGFGGK